MDKLAEDSVLCRVRAKRGCATHPRSIAERVRLWFFNACFSRLPKVIYEGNRFEF